MMVHNCFHVAVMALLTVGVFGHPHLSEDEFAEYKMLQARGTEDLAHCLKSPELQEIHSRMVAEHGATLHRLRKTRGIQMTDSALTPRDKPDLLAWAKNSHKHDGQHSQDPQDLWKFKWSEEPRPYTDTSGCILTPESIPGPYWAKGQLERQDIKDNQQGIPLRLALQVIDTATCLPVQDARVDVWHANAKGEYDMNANGTLRGWQPSSIWGTVDYDTIFPGHYAGRATHIHTAVMTFDQTEAQEKIAHFGMLYFDQSLITQVEAKNPYNSNKTPIVLNKDDEFAPASSNKQYDPFVEYNLIGSRLEDGIMAWIPIGVNLDADHAPKRKRFLMNSHLEQ